MSALSIDIVLSFLLGVLTFDGLSFGAVISRLLSNNFPKGFEASLGVDHSFSTSVS